MGPILLFRYLHFLFLTLSVFRPSVRPSVCLSLSFSFSLYASIYRSIDVSPGLMNFLIYSHFISDVNQRPNCLTVPSPTVVKSQ